MINVIKFTFKELIKNKSYKLTTLFLVAITIIILIKVIRQIQIKIKL